MRPPRTVERRAARLFFEIFLRVSILDGSRRVG
jgi:hypothetical protein